MIRIGIGTFRNLEFGILNYELVALWAIKNYSMKNLKYGTEGH